MSQREEEFLKEQEVVRKNRQQLDELWRLGIEMEKCVRARAFCRPLTAVKTLQVQAHSLPSSVPYPLFALK